MNPDRLTADVPRVASVDARSVLERLVGAGLVERGSVIVLSVEGIRERAGDRWPRKRDDVWEYVERKCDEHLSFQDIRCRISETDYVIATTAEEGLAAQAICLKILEEVLIFFLGSAERVNLTLHTVSGIEGDTLTCKAVDLARVMAARSRPTAQRPADAAEETRRNPISFVTASGETVRVAFAMEHVISLRHQVVAALRAQPIVTSITTGAAIPAHAFAKLADEDVAHIDHATLRYAALFCPKDIRSGPSVIVPASFRTMGSRKGRSTLIGVEGAPPEQVKQGIIVELTDVDAGTPTGRLVEVVGLVSQLTRGVMARIHPARDAMAPLRGGRFMGITLDVGDLALDDRRLPVLLQAMAIQMRGKAPSLIAQGLHGPAWLKHAYVAGFTHGALRAATGAAAATPRPPPPDDD